jgi:hypothetical protein
MCLLSFLQLLRLKYVNVPHLLMRAIPCTYHHPSFDHPNNNWYTIQIKELIITQFSPQLCYISCIRPQYPRQHLVFTPPRYMGRHSSTLFRFPDLRSHGMKVCYAYAANIRT